MAGALGLTGCTIDLDAAEVRWASRVERLTATEVRLVRYLVGQAGTPVEKATLLSEVWGYRPGVASRTVDTTVQRLRAKVEVEPELRWASIGPVVDWILGDDLGIELPAGEDAFADALERAVPGSRRAVRRYLQDTRQISSALGRLLMSRSLATVSRAFAAGPEVRLAEHAVRTPAREGLRALPEELRPVMGMRWGYLGTELDSLSFAGLAASTAHFLDGGFYPIGGAGEIARTLGRTIAQAGGGIVVGWPVRRIRAEGGLTVEGPFGELQAPAVVSAIGAPGTLALLDSPPSDWAGAIRALPLSQSHVALYMALEDDPRRHGMDGANVWGVTPGTREVGWYASFPSIRDPAWTGPPLASIIQLVPWEEHAAQGDPGRPRPPEYTAYKEAIGRRLLAEVAHTLPWLPDAVARLEVATPATVRHFIDAPEGATYGLAATPARFARCDAVFLAGYDRGMLLLLSLAWAGGQPVTFVGIDYSLAKFIGSGDFQDVSQVTGYYPGEWNRLWATEMMEDLAKAAGPVTQRIDVVAADNAKLTEAQILRQDGGDELVTGSDITTEKLQSLVRGYDMKDADGLGLVLVVDRYVKLQETGCTWVVYFDAKTKDIRAQERVCEKAQGFGFRNYWFRTAKSLIDDIRKLKPR